MNAFFVAAHTLPTSFVPRPLEEVYRPPNYDGRGSCHPHDWWRVMIDPAAGGATALWRSPRPDDRLATFVSRPESGGDRA